MNHTDFRTSPDPVLKLPRRPAATSVSEFDTTRTELAAELDALREREANLRAYEERLRTWQMQLDAHSSGAPLPLPTAPPFLRPNSRSPFPRDPALEAAWDKLHRARALLDAEQNQLCDERLKFRDAAAALEQREAELAARETRLAAREQQAAASPAPAESAGESANSTAWNLTQAPFRAAKAIFRAGS